MAQTPAQRKFTEHFTSVMGGTPYAALAAFIKSLKFGQLTECLTTYLEIFSDYPATKSESLQTFYDLSATALDKGDVYFALRFELLVSLTRTKWHARFKALTSPQQGLLNKKVATGRKPLTQNQRRFITLFESSMRTGKMKAVSEHIFDAPGFDGKHQCLLTYMAISERYADDDVNSLYVFFGAASLCLAQGTDNFAARFERLIDDPATVWAIRFSKLNDQQSIELRKQIKTKKRNAASEPDSTADGIVQSARIPRRTAVQKRFAATFERYMADRKHDEQDISKFVDGLSTLQELRECLIAYFELSAKYKDDDDASLKIFYGISFRALGLGNPYYAMKYEASVNKENSVWNRRFLGLSTTQRATLQRAIDESKDNARIIDDLRFAYFLKHRSDADLAALKAFEPEMSDDLKRQLEALLQRCHSAFYNFDLADFSKAFDEIASLFKAQKDGLSYLTMLKWCRESKIAGIMRYEIYWYGVASMFIYALENTRLVYDKVGLSEEEKRFLLADTKASKYYTDFEQRLLYTVEKRCGREKLNEISKAHISLIIIAQSFGIALVPSDETADIRAAIELLRTANSIVLPRIPINNQNAPGMTLEIGDTVGNFTIIWWDQKGSQAYVEVKGLNIVLFAIESYSTLGRVYYNDALYGEIARNTQHLLVLIPVFFDIIGYLPDLISGGLTGLIKSVVVDYVAGELSTRALGDSMTGNIAATMLLDTLTGHIGDAGKIDDFAVGLAQSEAHQFSRTATRSASDVDLNTALQPPHVRSSSAPDVPSRIAPDGTEVLGPLARSDLPPVRAGTSAPAPMLALPSGRVSASVAETAAALGMDPYQVQAMADLLNKPFTSAELKALATAWNGIAVIHADRIRAIQGLFETSNLTKKEIASAAREQFNEMRKDFWTYVGTSNDLAAKQIRDKLSHAGFTVPVDGTAPFMRIQPQQAPLNHPDGSSMRGSSIQPPVNGAYEFRLDIDHLDELGQNPAKAFSSANLRLTPKAENRVLLNQIQMQDPFQSQVRLTTGRGTSRAGKLIGDPNYKGRSPKRGLLSTGSDKDLNVQAQQDAIEAVEEALRRIDESTGDSF